MPKQDLKKKAKVPIICPTCGGHGLAKVIDKNLFDDIRCPRCRGAGNIGYSIEECE